VRELKIGQQQIRVSGSYKRRESDLIDYYEEFDLIVQERGASQERALWIP
jgi:hypothetical protein